MRTVLVGKRAYEVFPTIYQGHRAYHVRPEGETGSVTVTLHNNGRGLVCDHRPGCADCVHVRAVRGVRRTQAAEQAHRQGTGT